MKVTQASSDGGVDAIAFDPDPIRGKFAKGKPLVLLNGSNLLAMLEKHGKQACIDMAWIRFSSDWVGSSSHIDFHQFAFDRNGHWSY